MGQEQKYNSRGTMNKKAMKALAIQIAISNPSRQKDLFEGTFSKLNRLYILYLKLITRHSARKKVQAYNMVVNYKMHNRVSHRVG